jgi:iron(III) transport system permease protein
MLMKAFKKQTLAWSRQLLALLLILPLISLLILGLQWDEASKQTLTELMSTVLPDYAVTSLVLCLVVGVGVAIVGVATACCVSLFEFKGKRILEIALLLPLAMPAYVLAYAYTDYLQYSGPAQNYIRQVVGLEGRVLPEVRNMWGAAWVLVFALYPYVYVLVRAALSTRAKPLMEAARLLGAPMGRRIIKIAIPMARPAMAAGMTLALMECLADFGVVSYFGVQTFTTGIYKAWLALDQKIAAAQLAALLLLMVGLLIGLEKRAQGKLRFTNAKGGMMTVKKAGNDLGSNLMVLSGRRQVLAVSICMFPIMAGFILPVLFMLRPLLAAWTELNHAYWHQFADWTMNSLRLGLMSAALAVLTALVLCEAVRYERHSWHRHISQLAMLGYAIPGAVVVIGILLPITWLQIAWPQLGLASWLTTTSAALIWAYLLRFTAVAMQGIQSGYTRIPISYDESAQIQGASRWKVWREVQWPLLKTPTSAAALLVLVDVMKELPATLVLRPFNSDTLAVAAYQLARDERLGEAALPALSLVLVGLLPVLLLSKSMSNKSSNR